MLFIDANIYLGFYRTVTTSKLLRSLIDFKHDVLVTQQVVSEVERNKLKVVHRLLLESVESFPVMGRSNLPDQLQNPELIERLERLQEAFDQLQESVESAVVTALNQVSHSTDAVSQMLKPIFESAIPASEDELDRARMRRELGHPPGKGRDPLGDQLSWEQVLSRIEPGSHVWVVSKDSDFLLCHNRHCVLDPSLHDDLLSRGKSMAQIHPFDSLVETLKHYQQVTGLQSGLFPAEEECERIAQEERRIEEVWKKQRNFAPGGTR